MELLVSLNGKFPRSEKLIRATQDFERGRITQETLERFFSDDYEKLMELQKGWKLVSDGLLNWQDHLRPFAEIFMDTEVNGLKRYFETNNFIRVLNFKEGGILRGINENWINNYFRFGNMAILPGPLFFQLYSTNLNTQNLLDMYFHLLPLLRDRNLKLVLLYEPAFSIFKNLHIYEKLIVSVKHICNGLRVVVYFAFTRLYGDDILMFMSMGYDGVGVDLTYTPVSELINLEFPPKKGLFLGLVDTTISHVEELSDLINALSPFVDKNLDFITLTGSSDFEFIPLIVAKKKISLLVELQRRFLNAG